MTPSSETPASPLGAISDQGKDTRDEQTASLLSRLKEAERELANLREWRWSFDPLTLTHAMVVGLLAEVNDNDAGRDLAETLEAVRDNLTVAARDLQAAKAQIKVLERALIEARGELFDLCEHTGDECLIKIRAACDGDVVHPGKEHELGFYRGRYSEAKAISRSMGDVFRDLLARSALPQLGGENG